MKRTDNLSGLAEGLDLGKRFLADEAETAFLEMGIAKDPYPPQKTICNSTHKISVLMGGNRTGKSHVGAYKMAWDLTGLYPDWYTGPKTVRGIDAWVLGDTGENTRDACQRKLFGPNADKPGWTDRPGVEGLIPAKYIIGKPSRKSAPPGAFDTVHVKHIPSDTTSTVSFKSHQMDRQTLASWNGDRVWVDEECPLEILEEIIARLMDRKGSLTVTMCPLDGVTPTVKFLLTGPADLVLVDYLTHADAKHLDGKEKANIKRLYASNPSMMIARTEGRATVNTGLIFPFPEKDIIYDASRISVPKHALFLGGYDPGFRHPTGATAMGWDRLADVIYVYGSYEQAGKSFSHHHNTLLDMRGENMTYMIDPASDQVNQAEGNKILEGLWKMAHGRDWAEIPEEKRKYIKANNSFLMRVDALWNRFQTRRLLIANNLTTLLGQYNAYAWNKDGTYCKDETDANRYDVLTSMAYGVLGVPEYAHRLDTAPPWMPDDLIPTTEVADWTPFRAGRNDPQGLN